MAYIAHGILQARILEWVAFPSPEDLPNPGIEPRSPTLQADSFPAEPQALTASEGAAQREGVLPEQRPRVQRELLQPPF